MGPRINQYPRQLRDRNTVRGRRTTARPNGPTAQQRRADAPLLYHARHAVVHAAQQTVLAHPQPLGLQQVSHPIRAQRFLSTHSTCGRSHPSGVAPAQCLHCLNTQLGYG